MPSIEQMAELCALVGHLNQFDLTKGRMHGVNSCTNKSHAAFNPKTVVSEDSDSITDTITHIIGFVHWESIVEGGLFTKALSECERKLVQRIEVLQREFPNVGTIKVTLTPEGPPMSWILEILRSRYVVTDKQPVVCESRSGSR